MIIQKITGGLGNQMFQYAYVKALSVRIGQDFKLDISGFDQYKLHAYGLELLDIEKKYASEIPFHESFSSENKYINYGLLYVKGLLKKLNPQHHVEKQFNFDKKFLTIDSGYIEGYFQTEQYFKDFEDVIRKDFIFKAQPSKENQQIIDTIHNCNAVSIHLRRGDYISNPANAFYNVCDIQYYRKAIQYIEERTQNPIFFIFSDDIDRAKTNLMINGSSHFIDWNKGNVSYEDMRLMSLCKHNIIANSSFSRWGAWLNAHPDKIVIAPQRRFATSKLNYSDIIPSSWVKI